MTFDIYKETGDKKKSTTKSLKMFGSCLGPVDKDDSPHKPDPSNSSKPDDILKQEVTLDKHTYEQFGHSTLTKAKRNFLGRKCKPGGCLDPPFGEDKYSYLPRHQVPLTNSTIVHHTFKTVENVVLADGMKNKLTVKKTENKNNSYNDISEEPLLGKKSDAIINLHVTESPLKSKTEFLYDKRESISPRTRIPSKNKNSIRNVSRRSTLSENKAGYSFSGDTNVLRTEMDNDFSSSFGSSTTIEKNPNQSSDEVVSLRTKVSNGNNDNKSYDSKQIIEEKHRQMIKEPLSGFFIPPKGVKRDTTQLSSLASKSNSSVIKIKSMKKPIIPVPVSKPFNSITVEQMTGLKTNNDTDIQNRKTADYLGKSKTDLERKEQLSIKSLEEPISIKNHVASEGVISINIHSTSSKLGEKLAKVSKEIKVQSPIITRLTTQSITLSENVETNKKVSATKIEETLLLTNKSVNINDYEINYKIEPYSDITNNEITKNDTTEPKCAPFPKFDMEIKFDSGQDSSINNSKINNMNAIMDATTNNNSDFSSVTVKISTTLKDIIDSTCLKSEPATALDKNDAFCLSDHDKTIYNLSDTDVQSNTKQQKINTVINACDYINNSNIYIPMTHPQSPKTQDIEPIAQKIEKLSKHDLDVKKVDIVNLSITNEIPESRMIRTKNSVQSPLKTSIVDLRSLTRSERSSNTANIKFNAPITNIQCPKESTKFDDRVSHKIVTTLPTPTVSNSSLDIYLEMAFHSYLNSSKARVLSTVDASSATSRHSKDSIILIKSKIKLSTNDNYHGLIMPIDSEHNMLIDFKKTDNKTLSDNRIIAKPAPKSRPNENRLKRQDKTKCTEEKLFINENEKVLNMLEDLYKKELVPLQMIIKDLKQEIDAFADQFLSADCNKKDICLKIKSKLYSRHLRQRHT